MQISHYMAEYLAAMSFKGNRIDRLYEQIRSTVDHINQDEDVGIKVVVDTDPGIIRIYDQETDSLKRATSSLYDLLELSYSTAEHHPYWSLLYNATEILKTILDKWLADFSRDEIDDMSWRINQLVYPCANLSQYNINSVHDPGLIKARWSRYLISLASYDFWLG